jgi:glycosyltransferase involved in cell wall biosynthesis
MSGTRQAEPKPLRVCVISAAPTAGRCGIHDFAERLVSVLGNIDGVEATILLGQDWSPLGTWRLLGHVGAMRADVVHMQYPMIVGWRSIGPHLLGFPLQTPLVVTIHEFSSFTKLRRASIGAFAVAAKRLIFTTHFERDNFLKSFPRSDAKISVVPIGSNIPFLPYRPRSETSIIHFGQVKPGRGLEDFLQLARIAAHKSEPWRFKVVGAPVTWAEDFAAAMQQQSEGTNVTWCMNLDDMEVSETIRGATAAYLPYPDGVSERRGSLIATLGNGVPVVTTRGPFQTAELDEVVQFASDPAQAYVEVAELVRRPEKAATLRSAALRYVKRFDWAQIAEEYHVIYRMAARL